MTTMTRIQHYKEPFLYGVVVSVYRVAVENGSVHFLMLRRDPESGRFYSGRVLKNNEL